MRADKAQCLRQSSIMPFPSCLQQVSLARKDSCHTHSTSCCSPLLIGLPLLADETKMASKNEEVALIAFTLALCSMTSKGPYPKARQSQQAQGDNLCKVSRHKRGYSLVCPKVQLAAHPDKDVCTFTLCSRMSKGPCCSKGRVKSTGTKQTPWGAVRGNSPLEARFLSLEGFMV